MKKTFCKAQNSLDATATNVDSINLITLQNGLFDELHITKNIAFEDNHTISDKWDYDTILHAMFSGNLYAGNVEYSAEQVNCIRIKRRKKNTYRWITLFEIPIANYKDFSFERFDTMCRSDTEYEYALIPMFENVEGNMNINSIMSNFEGIFIMEKERAFNTILDAAITNTQQNKATSVVTTLGNKYPFVISNGESSYYTGTMSGMFIEHDDVNCVWKVKEGFSYREQLMDFLSNGRPKFLKTDDGRAWIIKVIDSMTETEQGHPEYIKTSFSFAETGDCESGQALYNNNLIDSNIEGV